MFGPLAFGGGRDRDHDTGLKAHSLPERASEPGGAATFWQRWCRRASDWPTPWHVTAPEPITVPGETVPCLPAVRAAKGGAGLRLRRWTDKRTDGRTGGSPATLTGRLSGRGRRSALRAAMLASRPQGRTGSCVQTSGRRVTWHYVTRKGAGCEARLSLTAGAPPSSPCGALAGGPTGAGWGLRLLTPRTLLVPGTPCGCGDALLPLSRDTGYACAVRPPPGPYALRKGGGRAEHRQPRTRHPSPPSFVQDVRSCSLRRRTCWSQPFPPQRWPGEWGPGPPNPEMGCRLPAEARPVFRELSSPA